MKIKTHLLSLARNERFQRLVFSGVFFLSTVVILGYLVFRERDLLFEYRWEFHLVPAILSFPLYTAALLMVASIWGWMMNTLTKKLAFKLHFRYYAISNVTKRLPGTIWYIASRAHLYHYEGIDPKVTTLASGMEMLITTVSSILIGLIFGITILTESRVNIITLSSLFVICVFLLHPKSIKWLAKLLKIEIVQLNYIITLQWIGAFCLSWMISGSLLFVIGNIFVSIPVQQLGYFIGSFSLIGALSTVVFFLPSNFGITEVGLSLFLARILPAHIAVAIAIGFRLLVTFYDVVWAGICWKTLPHRHR